MYEPAHIEMYEPAHDHGADGGRTSREEGHKLAASKERKNTLFTLPQSPTSILVANLPALVRISPVDKLLLEPKKQIQYSLLLAFGTGSFSIVFLLNSLTKIPTFSSPLPTGDVPAPSRFQGRTEKSAGKPIEVNLALGIIHAGQRYEHWLLAIGNDQAGSELLSAVVKFDKHGNTLPVEYLIAHYNPAPEVVQLGTASFKDEKEKENVVKDILAIEIDVPSNEKGGNCMDFIKSALKLMKDKGNVDESVVGNYDDVYKKRYHDVAKKVFDADLQP
ncbi:hypothetical protein F5876DRAFT_69360 [Lentinula aff. lateritia]|uniref:Uncharacterized protein n=1 Tax=Lentinula aff. lateritia TaxID=2804960 RepID=A0ACC1TMI5_9AGAR|nr:hypothetical protein F5876DRAFT_69360 [Lentinula aff. lateritia]